jgi:hypothetical protein
MKRSGVFAPETTHASNQCKEKSTHLYDYECKILFDESQQLDNQEFLIEHQDIDDAIQKLNLNGSCEIMAKDIVELLQSFFELKKKKVNGIKIEIFPYPRGKANMSYIYIKDKSFAPLLNS